MPANYGEYGSMTAMTWLLRLFSAWRQRRAARRRARLHSFMDVSDRVLADIGVRRADVYGAMIGVAPLRRAVAPEGSPEAEIYELPRRPPLTVVANDLGAAA